MTIEVSCENPSCRKLLRVKDDLAGKRARCPACRESFTIPALPAAAREQGRASPDQPERPSGGQTGAARPGRTWPLLAGVLAAALVAACAAGGWFSLQARSLAEALARAEQREEQAAASAERARMDLGAARQQFRESTRAQQALGRRLTATDEDADKQRRLAREAAGKLEMLGKRLAAAEKESARLAKESKDKLDELGNRLAAAEKETARAVERNRELSKQLAAAQRPAGTEKKPPETPPAAPGVFLFKERRRLEKQGTKAIASKLTLSPDGRLALSCGEEGEVFLWDTQTGKLKKRFVGHEERPVSALAFTPDGKRFLSGGYDGRVQLWDIETGKTLSKFEGLKIGPTLKVRGKEYIWHEPKGVLAAPGGQLGLAYSRLRTWLWDLKTGKEVRRLDAHGKALIRPGGEGYSFHRAVFTADGKHLLACIMKETSPESYELGVWDIETGKEVRRFPHTFKSDQWIDNIAVTASGQHLISCSRDRTIRTWEIESGREVRSLMIPGKGRIDGFALSPDGRVALHWERRIVEKWTTERIELGGGRFEVRATQRRVPDGEPTVKLWDIQTGKALGSTAYKGELWYAVFSAKGGRLLLGGKDDVRLWEAGG